VLNGELNGGLNKEEKRGNEECEEGSDTQFEMDNSAPSARPLNDSYSDTYQDIGWYLTTLARPPWLSQSAFREVMAKSKVYSVRDRQLWKNPDNVWHIPRLVIDAQDHKTEIIKALHDEVGHGGRENTYRRVAFRYYWPGCFVDVKRHVDKCEPCQKKEKARQETALYPQRAVSLFYRVNIDCITLPQEGNWRFLCILRCDASGWPEAKKMVSTSSLEVAEFL
jgi:hypothetical protein